MEGQLRVNSRANDEKILAKAKNPKPSPSKSLRSLKTLANKIANIVQTVDQYLGSKRSEYELILTKEDLNRYIKKCIDNDLYALDTETTSLDPMTCKLVGFGLYTHGEKPCYIPVNHVDYTTGERLNTQLTEKDVAEYMKGLAISKARGVYFNAKYDIRVLRHTIGVSFKPYYDGYIAARLLNENEPDGGLKGLHQKYVLNGKEDEFSFGALFKGVDFSQVPIDTAFLYAAHDPLVTMELYDFQLPYITQGTRENKAQKLEGVANIFWNIEMPLITVVADMEDAGVKFDFDYQKVLSKEYHEELDKAEQKYYTELKKYTENVYSISSSKQLCELFYDDLKILEPVFDRKSDTYKRTVDAETLSNCNHPLAKLILEYRACAKLLSTYIDKLKVVAERDGRIHGSFNQMGTDTGRFSSSSPNLQNIPSHNTKIRKLFTASEGYVLVGADFSKEVC